MRELALFSGVGGGILGGKLLGWRTVCGVELEPYAASVLVARQNDGCLPPFPIWSDIRSFNGREWQGAVDIISGGFPCQDISAAGQGAGLAGKRSGLWFEMLRVIKEVNPRFVFIENSPMLRRRGLGTILSGLSQAGYHAAWTVLGADEVGAPHIRKRIWILAAKARRSDILPHAEYSGAGRREQWEEGSPQEAESPVVDPYGDGRQTQCVQAGELGQALGEKAEGKSCGADCTSGTAADINPGACSWWCAEPGMARVAHGLANRVERIRAIGNGQVPLVAATAFCVLYRLLTGRAFDTSRRA